VTSRDKLLQLIESLPHELPGLAMERYVYRVDDLFVNGFGSA
jgi:hypothetical protein